MTRCVPVAKVYDHRPHGDGGSPRRPPDERLRGSGPPVRWVFALVVGAAICSAGATWKPAIAQAPVPSIPPLCTAGVSAAAGPAVAMGNSVAETVTLSRAAAQPCVVAGYPELADAARVGPARLGVGHISLESSTTVETQDAATFVLRYVRARGARGACALAVFVNGAKAGGAPVAISPCTAVSQIDVSSFASVSENPPVSPSPARLGAAAAAAHPAPCNVGDLRVRAVASDPGAGTVREIVAVQNQSLAACTLENDLHAQLFDAQGRLAPVPIAPVVYGRGTPRQLTLEAGHEASLTLTYATTDPSGKTCPASQSIALALGTRGFTASAPAMLAPCVQKDGFGLHQTPLRLGVPLPGYD